MSDLNHSLYADFPHHRERIHDLKQNDSEFARLASEYHQVDHTVRGLEARDIPTSDQHFEQMKVQRLRLKDELYRRLNGRG